MTLDQRAWCAPITLKISQDEDKIELMRLIKSSPVDKGTTVSLYKKQSGQLMSRTIATAQNKEYQLKVQYATFLQVSRNLYNVSFQRLEHFEEEEPSLNSMDLKDECKLVQKRLYEESFSENLLRLQVCISP